MTYTLVMPCVHYDVNIINLPVSKHLALFPGPKATDHLIPSQSVLMVVDGLSEAC